MSRTQPRDVLNLSFSSVSLSEASELDEEDVDVKVEKILAKEIRNYEVIDALPPTPMRPTTRSRTRCSVSPSVSSILSTPPRRKDVNADKRLMSDVSPGSTSSFYSTSTGIGTKGPRDKRSEKEKNICKRLGIDLDDSELREIDEDDDEQRVPVDNFIDDLINLGLGKKKRPGGVNDITVEEEKREQQFRKLRNRAPLQINGDGRCAVLKEDVLTVKKTLESVNALIAVLEKTRSKLINEDKDLVFTPPPVRTKKKPKIPRGGIVT